MKKIQKLSVIRTRGCWPGPKGAPCSGYIHPPLGTFLKEDKSVSGLPCGVIHEEGRKEVKSWILGFPQCGSSLELQFVHRAGLPCCFHPSFADLWSLYKSQAIHNPQLWTPASLRIWLFISAEPTTVFFCADHNVLSQGGWLLSGFFFFTECVSFVSLLPDSHSFCLSEPHLFLFCTYIVSAFNSSSVLPTPTCLQRFHEKLSCTWELRQES